MRQNINFLEIDYTLLRSNTPIHNITIIQKNYLGIVTTPEDIQWGLLDNSPMIYLAVMINNTSVLYEPISIRYPLPEITV